MHVMKLIWLWATLMLSAAASDYSFYSCTRLLEISLDCSNINLGTLKARPYTRNYTKFTDISLRNTSLVNLEANVFDEMTHLKYLYMSNNLLETLHYRLFYKLKNLIELDLRRNRLTSLVNRRLFKSQRRLSYLLLAGNRLTILDASVFTPLKSLNTLDLSNNPLICDCQLHTALLWCKQRRLETNATCEHAESPWTILHLQNCTENSNESKSPEILSNQILMLCGICIGVVLVCVGFIWSIVYCIKVRKCSSRGNEIYSNIRYKEDD